jgi:hypothetical protein
MPFGRMDADLWSVGAACFCQKTYACGVGGRRSRGSSQMSRTFSVALWGTKRWRTGAFAGGSTLLLLRALVSGRIPAPATYSVVFLGIFVCSQTGSHPYEDVTKSGYKLYIKYKSLIILLYFWLHNESQIYKFGFSFFLFSLTSGNWKPSTSFLFQVLNL